jgi:hypothetical protein
MRSLLRPSPMLLWAVREVMRRPAHAAALFSALTLTTALVAVTLQLGQSLDRTCRDLLADAPAIVVRRVSTGGWSPLPVAEALGCAKRVPGALRPRVRVWGVVTTAAGRAVTVVGWASSGGDGHAAHGPAIGIANDAAWIRPGKGQVILGPGLEPAVTGGPLVLTGRASLALEVAGRLPADSSSATHDLAVVHVEDARRLLGLQPGQASDLVLDIFRHEETEALCKALADAFPWPVQLMTRAQREEFCLSDVARRSGIGLLAFVPLLAAVAVLVLAVGVWGHRQRWTMGLYKAMGWTGQDILGLHVRATLLLAGPAAVVGIAMGYGLLFLPGISWVTGLLYGWSPPAPALYLTARGLAAPFTLTLLLTVVPFLCAGFWAGWQASLTDPGEMM